MDLQLLIDSIVRQTTVLIAQLATAGGTRAPLSEIADRVFLELADELRAQGVSRKVSADMFGMALRTYQRRLQRVRESATDQGRTLWEAVYDHLLSADGLVTRAEILQRFRRDDPETVHGILHDLGDAGLVLRLGKGQAAAFRAADAQELSALQAREARGPSDELVWAVIYREGPLTRAELDQRVRKPGLDEALARLCDAGQVVCHGHGQTARYATHQFHVPLGAEQGWEAAVFDHFQALVRTITTKLRADTGSRRADQVGGSTFEMDVWPGHPLEGEVLGHLERFRTQLGDLRARVRAHNAQARRPVSYQAVTIYGGQCVTSEDREDIGDHDF